LVPGPNPARVVLDQHLRCEPTLRLFRDDEAPTFIICSDSAPMRDFPSSVKVLRLRGKCTMRGALDRLHAEGLRRIFIEGGGSTVSACVKEGVLDRLHVAVAPILIGAGIRGLSLPHIRRFGDALRPSCRHFPLGRDVLFDFEWPR
jgi:riboflavin biosynthesis pyrimidine reductase